MKEKILLTGSQRSGTTFVGNLLNAQDDCVFLRDSFVAVFRTSWDLGVRTFTGVLPIRLRNIILFSLKAEMILKGIDKLNNLQPDQFTTLEELFDLAMELLVDDSTKVFGIKVTEEGHWIKILMKETNIKVIYLVRDLRDVLLSSANAFVDYDRKKYAKRWFRGLTEVLKINDPRIILVRFEDLILNPEKELERLSDFLGVKLTSEIEEVRDVSGTTWMNNSSFHDVVRLFDPTTVNRWKTKLASYEVIYGSIVYRKLMKRMGYEENKQSFLTKLRVRIVCFIERVEYLVYSLLLFRVGRKVMRNIKKMFSDGVI